ncbi:MAG: glycosyltransferase family 4 protein [Terriglobales bacterium]
MMDAKGGAAGPRIVGLTLFGDPFDRTSWSGSNWSLFSGLQRRSVLQDAGSVDLTLPQKLLSAAMNFSLDRRRIYLDLMKSRESFYWRSRNAEAILRRQTANFNCVLQVSALYLPSLPKDVLHCSYHDGNTAVSRRPEFSFMSAASPRVMRDSWAYEMDFYRRMNLIFTMSEWLRQSMIVDFRVAEERVVAVGAGVNFSSDIDYAKESLGKDPSAKIALFVATNFEHKGGPALVEAFRQVRQEVPQAELWIVGCTPGLNEPGIRELGVLDKSDPAQEAEMRNLYSQATVFVLPTLYDAFGIAFVEAMYYRLPCIGSNRCAVPEIVADGETGFIVDPTSVLQLRDKMLTLFKDDGLATRMGEAGYQRAKSRYSWDIAVDTMLEKMRQTQPHGVATKATT